MVGGELSIIASVVFAQATQSVQSLSVPIMLTFTMVGGAFSLGASTGFIVYKARGYYRALDARVARIEEFLFDDASRASR